MDPVLANQFATREAQEEEAASTALTMVGENPGTVASGGGRSWTKHPAFWFTVATITGIGVVSIAMRYSSESPKTKRIRGKSAAKVTAPSESLFEVLEDDGGLDDEDEPDEAREEEEIEAEDAPIAAAPEKKPRKKRSDAGKPRKPRASARAKKEEMSHASV